MSPAINIYGQTLVVKVSNGTEYSKGLSTVQKLTFPNNTVLVQFKNGTSDSYNISNVSKIYFKGVISATQNPNFESAEKLTIFPNPVDNLLFIQNNTEGVSLVKIFRLDGSLLISSNISTDNQSVDVSNLPSGMYVIKMNNQVSKFVKQ
jgi:Secretion system C-terminal sorting domain